MRREDLSRLRPGAVIVDVAVDRGGCVETIDPTTHENPTYTVDGIIHSGVANMPGAVPRTSTLALTNATLPFTLMLANKGRKQALRDKGALPTPKAMGRSRPTSIRGIVPPEFGPRQRARNRRSGSRPPCRSATGPTCRAGQR